MLQQGEIQRCSESPRKSGWFLSLPIATIPVARPGKTWRSCITISMHTPFTLQLVLDFYHRCLANSTVIPALSQPGNQSSSRPPPFENPPFPRARPLSGCLIGGHIPREEVQLRSHEKTHAAFLGFSCETCDAILQESAIGLAVAKQALCCGLCLAAHQ